MVVRDTAGRPDGANGRGIQLQAAATATLRRVLIERSKEVGLLATDGSAAVAEDLIVRDMRSVATTLRNGRGIGAEDGSTIDVTRGLVTDVLELGVAAFGEGAGLNLQDMVMTDVHAAACAETTCPDEPMGTALGAYLGGAVEARVFQIRAAALCGAQVALDGSLDLSEGEIASSTFGACVQVYDYDVSRLTQDVLYQDNGVNLEATSLPVPEPLPTVGR